MYKIKTIFGSMLIGFIMFGSLNALDSDPRPTREVIIEIDQLYDETFTAINEVQENICDKFEQTWTILAALEAALSSTCAPTIIRSGPFTISTPGPYCLVNNITGPVTISISDVLLDGNGNTINGGTNGISISMSTTNVKIKNIGINSSTDEGVLVNSGCDGIEIIEMTLTGCGSVGSPFGIHFDTCVNVQVNDTVITNCLSGVRLNSTDNAHLGHVQVLASSNSVGDFVGVSNEGNNNDFVACAVMDCSGLNACHGFAMASVSAGCYTCCTADRLVSTNQTPTGFRLANNSNAVLIDCSAMNLSGNGGADGFAVDTCDSVVFHECDSFQSQGTLGFGFHVINSDCVTCENCNSHNHGRTGFHAFQSTGVNIHRCFACDNAQDGISLVDTFTSLVINTASKGNGNDGFLADGGCINCSFGQNIANGNAAFGFDNQGTFTTTRAFYSNFATANTFNLNIAPNPTAELGDTLLVGVNIAEPLP